MRTLMRISQNTLASILTLSLVSTFFINSASAQGVKMGLSITPNASWMVSTDYDHVPGESQINFGFEFVTDFMFEENLAFSTGVHVFNTGGNLSYLVVDAVDDDYLLKVDRGYNLRYVEIPLTFKMRTKEIGYSTIYGRFGLGLGMNIRSEAEEARYRSWNEVSNGVWAHYSTTGSPVSEIIEVQNDVRLFRSSMVVGGGVERSLGGTSSLVIGVNYNVGFSNTHKDITQVKIDNENVPVVVGNEVSLSEMKGHDSFLELCVGLIF